MRKVKIKIAYSIIGIIFGLSGCLTFMIYSNQEASLWSLISAINAALCLVLHYGYLRGTMQAFWSLNKLAGAEIVGVVSFLVGCGLIIFYIFLQIYSSAPMLPIRSSVTIRLVWSFMMTKWGLLLAWSSKKYTKILNEQPLFTEGPNIQEI